MKRRDFIRMGSFITVSAATLGVTGCGSDNTNTSITRAMPPLATGGTWKFPQSIASGDPRPDSIMLWTRVTSSLLLAPTDASTLSVAVKLNFTTADNSAKLGSTTALTGVTLPEVTVPAYGDFDGTARHKITGLTPDTVYYYQFTAGTVLSKVGRFKTAPATASSNPVKFAFMSCQEWSNNHWGAYGQILADDGAGVVPSLDFIVHLGDYIYETDAASSAEGLHSAIVFPQGTAIPPAKAGDPAPGGEYASALADYRYLYKLYRSDARIQAVHERFPMVAIWDDHEFSDDSWQASETYTNANASQPQRRRSANQAWFEFMPADITYSETDSSFNNISIYRDLKFGSVMHLVMTDERLYRADHMIPETTLSNGAELGRINSRYLAPEGSFKLLEGIKSPNIPGAVGDALAAVSMLGATQRDWWKTTMQGSTASWKIWGNEVSLLRMGLNGTNALATVISLGIYSAVTSDPSKSISAVAASAALTSPPASVNAAVVAAISQGATQPTAIAGATAIAVSAGGGGTDGDKVTAGVGAGLTVGQATAAVGAFNNAIAVGNITIAAAIVAVSAAGVSNTTTAGTIGFAITAADANPAAVTADREAAAMSVGASGKQSHVAVAAYEAAKAAKPAGAATQVQAAGAQIAFVYAKPDIQTNKTASLYFTTAVGAAAAAVAPFFQKFLLNADQWDGYSKERSNLMQFLLAQGIQNVVAITGDIHAFFAGEVYDTFAGEITAVNPAGAEVTASTGGTPAMVDLVTAGISSTSWFSYIKQAVDVLDPTNALIGKLVYVPVPIAAPANAFYAGSPAVSFTAYLNTLNYSMGKPAPATASALAAELNDQIKRGLAAAGVVEPALDGSAAAVQAGVAASATFAGALALAQQLGGLGVATNPWLKHVDTEAQGYAVVTASTASISCTFKKVNPLVGNVAPSAARTVVSTKTVTVNTGVVAVV